MSKLPIVDSRTMDRLLRSLGFNPVRRKGSHVSTGIPTPHHHSSPPPGRDLARPLIREILREIEVPPEEFERLLRD